MSQLMPRGRVGAMIDLALAEWSVTTDFFTLGLFKGAVPESPTLSVDDLVQPEGDWYAVSPGAHQGEKYLGPDGIWRVSIPGHQWNYTGTDPSETITGWFALNGDGDLVACKMLPNEVEMGSTDDSVVAGPLTLVFPYPFVE